MCQHSSYSHNVVGRDNSFYSISYLDLYGQILLSPRLMVYVYCHFWELQMYHKAHLQNPKEKGVVTLSQQQLALGLSTGKIL